MDSSQEATMDRVIDVDVCWERLSRAVERWKKVKVRIGGVKEREEVSAPLSISKSIHS